MDFNLAKLMKMAKSKEKASATDPKSNKVITVVNIRGEIGGGGRLADIVGSSVKFETLKPLLEQAFTLPGVRAVVLNINSPGGLPCQTSLIANFILHKKEETNIPVFAFVEDMAASGGYWLACCGDSIHVSENGMLGSIGVISLSVGVADLLKKYGVQPRVLTTAKNKSMMNPLQDFDATQAALVKRTMTDIQRNFIRFVKKRRPSLAESDDVFTGRVFVGEDAVKMGLADGVSTLSELLELKFPNEDDLQLFEVKMKEQSGNLLGLLSGLMTQAMKTMVITSVQALGGLQTDGTGGDMLYHDPTMMLN